MQSDSVVIIPTYNEKENISNMIHTVLAIAEHQFDILVIDDNSPDGTGAIVDALVAENPDRVHIIKRTGKLGLGTAYITGFKWALEQGSRWMPISRIPPTNCTNCRLPAPLAGPMWLSVRATRLGSMWSTGPWGAY